MSKVRAFLEKNLWYYYPALIIFVLLIVSIIFLDLEKANIKFIYNF